METNGLKTSQETHLTFKRLELTPVQDKLEQLTKHIPVDRIRIAIISVAKTYGIDPRVLLGIIMEESHGVVGAKTTWNADGVPTGGLMQASSCHGYDGQKDLAQVMRTKTLPPHKLILPGQPQKPLANKRISHHRLTSPTWWTAEPSTSGRTSATGVARTRSSPFTLPCASTTRAAWSLQTSASLQTGSAIRPMSTIWRSGSRDESRQLSRLRDSGTGVEIASWFRVARPLLAL